MYIFVQCTLNWFYRIAMICMWQTQVEINIILLRISTELPRSKRCSAELQLRVGLIWLRRLNRYSCCVFNFHPELPHMVSFIIYYILNESFVLQRFERGNAVKLHNKIMFNFYPELPHMVSFMHYHSTFSRVGAHQQWSSCTWQCHKCPGGPKAKVHPRSLS